jgi:hypothetical protein
LRREKTYHDIEEAWLEAFWDPHHKHAGPEYVETASQGPWEGQEISNILLLSEVLDVHDGYR